MRDEIVIKRDTRPKPGWPCPKCFGQGHMSDGGVSYGENEIRITQPTKCWVCAGYGRVHVTPAPPEATSEDPKR